MIDRGTCQVQIKIITIQEDKKNAINIRTLNHPNGNRKY